MNKGFFTGRLAKGAKLLESGVCYFTLINNEYAGRDDKGEAVERKVAVSFTAFGKVAKAIADHTGSGDQLIVNYRIQNNNTEKDGEIAYNYSFIVDEFEFGAKNRKDNQEAAVPQEPAGKSGKKK